MAKWENFQIPKHVHGDIDFLFVFQKYLFLKNDDDYNSAAASNLIFHQLNVTALKGKLGNISEDVAISLAGLQLQHENGDYDTSKQEKVIQTIDQNLGKYYPEVLTRHLLGKKTLQRGASRENATRTKGVNPTDKVISSLITKMIAAWTALKGTTKLNIEKQYMEKLKDFPFFGAVVFNVQYAIPKKGLKMCILAISSTGLSLWPLDNQMENKSFRTILYDEIASYGAAEGQVTITSGNLANPTVDAIITEQAHEIATTIRSYQEASAQAILNVRKTKGVRRFL